MARQHVTKPKEMREKAATPFARLKLFPDRFPSFSFSICCTYCFVVDTYWSLCLIGWKINGRYRIFAFWKIEAVCRFVSLLWDLRLWACMHLKACLLSVVYIICFQCSNIMYEFDQAWIFSFSIILCCQSESSPCKVLLISSFLPKNKIQSIPFTVPTKAGKMWEFAHTQYLFWFWMVKSSMYKMNRNSNAQHLKNRNERNWWYPKSIAHLFTHRICVPKNVSSQLGKGMGEKEVQIISSKIFLPPKRKKKVVSDKWWVVDWILGWRVYC